MSSNKNNYSTITTSSKNIIDKFTTINTIPLDTHLTQLKQVINEFETSANQLVNESNLLRIGIVGQVKAGKSSFLNALFFNGIDVLPKASTPMTAGLVIIEYAEKNEFEIEFFSENDWKIIEQENKYYQEKFIDFKESENLPDSEIHRQLKEHYPELTASFEMVSRLNNEARSKIGNKNETEEFSKISELQGKFEKYVGANGNYTSVVKAITLRINHPNLKDIQIIDTPGVNDPIISRERRTKEILKTCHGVFLLSYAGQFFSQEDQQFLENKIGTEGIQEVVVIASKYDSALKDVGHHYENDLQAAVSKVEQSIHESWKSRINDNSKLENLKLDLVSAYMNNLSLLNNYSKIDDKELEHTYNWFKNTFPNIFSDDANTKTIFEQLANFKNLYTTYVKKQFITRKDEIIGQKVNSFFIENNKNIIKEIEVVENYLKSKQDLLNQSDLKAAKNAKDNLQKNTTEIEKKFREEISAFNKKYKDEISENIKKLNSCINDFKITQQITPYKINIDTLIKKRTLWWDKTMVLEYYFSVINYDKYSNKIDAFINQARKEIIDYSSNDTVKGNINILTDRLKNIVSELVLQKSSSRDVFNKNISINDSIHKFIHNNFKSLNTDLEKIIKKHQAALKNYNIFQYSEISDINKGKVVYNESEIEQMIKNICYKKQDIISLFYNSNTTAFVDDLNNYYQKEVFNNIDKDTAIITKDVISLINDVFTEDIKILEENIKNKESTLQQLEQALLQIKEIKNLYV
jgi:predicted GTPase